MLARHEPEGNARKIHRCFATIADQVWNWGESGFGPTTHCCEGQDAGTSEPGAAQGRFSRCRLSDVSEAKATR